MTFNRKFNIGQRMVGEGCPTYIIAEIGRNHNGNMELAKKMIDAAACSGANAVKFQSFRAEELLIKELPKVSHIKETSGEKKSAYEATEEVELKPEQHNLLQTHAKNQGIDFFSTPEDHNMVELLDSLNVPVFKIASLDIVYLDLVEAIASKGRPIIMSTGMAYLGEIEKAISVLEKKGVKDLILLHCTSNYPPRYEDIHLNSMLTLSRCFKVPVGYSDHTLGIGVSIGAVALGACVIERHFTIDKNLSGPDQRLSLLPNEFKMMADEIRSVEVALGTYIKKPVKNELEMRRLHRRRLVASGEIKEGTVIDRSHISCKCSENGLEPEYIGFLVGRKTKMNHDKDTPFTFKSVCDD